MKPADIYYRAFGLGAFFGLAVGLLCGLTLGLAS